MWITILGLITGVLIGLTGTGGGVLLTPACCDPLYRKAIRTSMGAALGVPFARLDDWPDALTLVREAGFTIAALTPRAPSETLEAFAARPRLPPRLALLAGIRRLLKRRASR